MISNFKKKLLHLPLMSVLVLVSCETESINSESVTPESIIQDLPNAIQESQNIFLPTLEHSVDDRRNVTATAKNTVYVNDTNPATFAQSLINAVNSAGTNGIVQLKAGTYYTDYAIALPNIKITIKGAGKNSTYIKLKKNSGSAGLINIGANGTSLEGLSVDTQNKMTYYYSACAVNTNGKQDVYMYDVGFLNAGIGTGTADNNTGLTPAGLTLVACSFYNCDHGINYNRIWSQVPASWIKKMTVNACWFGGTQSAGISIDCGNDGNDGTDAQKYKPGAEQAFATITNMDGMEIKNCTFNKAKKYNIAIAKAWNVKIKNNILNGNTGTLLYGEAINLEHQTHNIVIEDNTISNLGLSNQNHSFISILSFRDYGNNTPQLLPTNGCRDIFIQRNTFKGDVQNGIVGEYATKIRINNNTFQNPAPTNKYVNFWVGCYDIWHWSNTNLPAYKISIVN